MIKLERVSKIYRRHQPDQLCAVEEISLAIPAGGVTVLKGPSGSGKTSLLAMIGCMSRPTSGQISLDGRDISRLPEKFLTALRRQTFGFVFQQFQLLPELSVEQNVLLPLYPLAQSLAEMERQAQQVLCSLGLEGKERCKVRQLSGGEQQRVAIARALVTNPQIVIADEPTAHLDSVLARELLEILGRLQAVGKSIIMATHDPRVYEHPLVTRVITLRDGKVADEAPE